LFTAGSNRGRESPIEHIHNSARSSPVGGLTAGYIKLNCDSHERPSPEPSFHVTRASTFIGLPIVGASRYPERRRAANAKCVTSRATILPVNDFFAGGPFCVSRERAYTVKGRHESESHPRFTQLSEADFYATVAEGLGLIVANVDRLRDAATVPYQSRALSWQSYPQHARGKRKRQNS
jgi:hypothetical protein